MRRRNSRCGNEQTSPAAKICGSLVRSVSSTAMPSATSIPAASASSVRGFTPMPAITQSHAMVVPSESFTPVTRFIAEPMIRSTCTAKRTSTPICLCRSTRYAATISGTARMSARAAASITITSQPLAMAVAAISSPINPAPTIAIFRPGDNSPTTLDASAAVRRTWTPSSVAPGTLRRRGAAPVAISRR